MNGQLDIFIAMYLATLKRSWIDERGNEKGNRDRSMSGKKRAHSLSK